MRPADRTDWALALLRVATVMLVAALVVHRPPGFLLLDGAEFTFTLAGACLAIAIAGPGRLSLDARLGRGHGAS